MIISIQKHILEDQVGGEKIDGIFFDKNLNGAYAVGEGVEQWPEDVCVCVIKGDLSSLAGLRSYLVVLGYGVHMLN